MASFGKLDTTGFTMEKIGLLFPDGKVPRDCLFFEPPTITTKTMAEVKALPELHTTYLITKLGPLHKSMFFENPDACRPDLAKAILFGVNYAVYLVDMDNFHQGKRKKLFQLLQICVCDPSSSSHQKNILSAFVLACQFPFTYPLQLHSWGQDNPSERPRTVLLETKEDANDPQVKLFLSMMGCSSVQKADHVLLDCLDETIRQSKIHELYSKQGYSTAYDLTRGIVCGFCENTNGKLKKCPCGKAYYCSQECQHDHWKQHKKEHKVAMKKSK